MKEKNIPKELQPHIMKFFLKTSVPRILKTKTN